MNPELLLQRGVLYGFVGGVVTTVLVVLVAALLNLSLGPVVAVLFFGAVLALVLLVGASGPGPGPAVGEVDTTAEEGFGGQMPNPTEASGASRNPVEAVVVPSTRLEYVVYFLGLGIAATVLLALLLN